MDEQASPEPPETNPDETHLLARMKAGDADAFELFVRTYCGRLLLVARRVLDNEEDAHDAVQDALLSAFKGIGQFEGQSGLGTWLHRVAVNAALDRLRTLQRRPERSIEDMLPHFGEGEHQLDPPVPWCDAPDTNLQRQESAALVRECIRRLPDTYRIVLLLRDIEGFDTEETAQLLKTSAAVVKMRLHRARQALRSLLDPHFRRGDV
jgi:RNA polymerase sigma-70 factor, ECF subfamily